MLIQPVSPQNEITTPLQNYLKNEIQVLLVQYEFKLKLHFSPVVMLSSVYATVDNRAMRKMKSENEMLVHASQSPPYLEESVISSMMQKFCFGNKFNQLF